MLFFVHHSYFMPCFLRNQPFNFKKKALGCGNQTLHIGRCWREERMPFSVHPKRSRSTRGGAVKNAVLTSDDTITRLGMGLLQGGVAVGRREHHTNTFQFLLGSKG